jgi:hypothetical protein
VRHGLYGGTMSNAPNRGWHDLALAAVLGGLVAGAVTGLVLMLALPRLAGSPLDAAASYTSSETPALDALDAVRCPTGFRRLVQVRGAEDNFSRTGEEPAEIDPALLRFRAFADLKAGLPRTQTLRNFDERRTDRTLLTWFDVPSGTVAGTLVLSYRDAGSGHENDYLGLMPGAPFAAANGAERLASYTLAMSTAKALAGADEPPGLLRLPLHQFVPSAGEPYRDVLSHMRAAALAGTSPALTLSVQDDTMVDVAGLVLCVEPDAVRGVTFSELSHKPMGADVSVLSCALDPTQGLCGPRQGDTACTARLPLACYRDGTGQKPPGLAEMGLSDANFVGGEVRPSEPVAGARFATLAAANAFCARQFGEGWRVLRYQEGGGATVISRSRIPAGARLWVDIPDQPRGRCWDRPEPGLILPPGE